MYRYRGYILSVVVCFAVQVTVLRLLESSGMREVKIWTVETLLMLAAIWITMSLGERFERK
jgi:hypothetical protein